MRTTVPLLAALALGAASVAEAAEVAAFTFIEGITGDEMAIENVAPCPDVVIVEVSIDLRRAADRVFFDAAPGAPGYDDGPVGIEFLRGSEHVVRIAGPEDGGHSLTIDLTEFDRGSMVQFTLDLDGEAGPVEGGAPDVNGPNLVGAAIAARIFSPAGVEKAEVGALQASGAGTVAWDGVCTE